MKRMYGGLAVPTLVVLMVFALMASVGSAQLPQAGLLIGKTADRAFVEPGSGVAYTVVFTNTGEVTILDTITDELPPMFQYVGLAVGSMVTEEPTDQDEPVIVWTGPFTVPANEPLALRYWAWVPPDLPAIPGPYTNTVMARHGETAVGPAEAAVRLMGSQMQIEKDVSPTSVMVGQAVTYTVTLENEGTGVGVVEVISDTLPAGFAFLKMVSSSDVLTEPEEAGNTIFWDGPFSMAAGGDLTLVYQARSAMVGGEWQPTNSVKAVVDGQTVGPASAAVDIVKSQIFLPLVIKRWSAAKFVVSKDATPTIEKPGGTITYRIEILNEGDLPGVINTIEDTLPAGFLFLRMAESSEIKTAPGGTSGTIVWNGPFQVGAHSQLTLVYEVRGSEVGGTYENRVRLTTLVGAPPAQDASAMVEIEPSILFEDGFEDGDDNWTPYTNLNRANEAQWLWDPRVGYDGSNAYTNNALGGVPPDKWDARGAHDSLSMYLGEGSEDWTNYRYSVRFNMLAGRLVGVWFRGAYRDSEYGGQWVTGYYCAVHPGDDRVLLQQIRTDEEHGDEDWPPYWYHFTNPLDLEEVKLPIDVEKNKWNKITVEVEGPRIKCYVNDYLAIDFTDTQGSIFETGTVGLYTYGKHGTAAGAAIVRFDDVIVEPLP